MGNADTAFFHFILNKNKNTTAKHKHNRKLRPGGREGRRKNVGQENDEYNVDEIHDGVSFFANGLV